MPAVMTRDELDRTVPDRLDLCPAADRVYNWYDDELAVATGYIGGSEGESVDDGGVIRQKCGGGHRIIRKKLS